MAVGELFCFTAYQPISGHLMQNYISLIDVYKFQDLPIFTYSYVQFLLKHSFM